MEEENQDVGNSVEIQLKKSSTKDAGLGYDIKVRCGDKATQEQMDRIAEICLKTARKCEITLGGR